MVQWNLSIWLITWTNNLLPFASFVGPIGLGHFLLTWTNQNTPLGPLGGWSNMVNLGHHLVNILTQSTNLTLAYLGILNQAYFLRYFTWSLAFTLNSLGPQRTLHILATHSYKILTVLAYLGNLKTFNIIHRIHETSLYSLTLS